MPALRAMTADQLQLHAASYRQLYVATDDEQAPTFDLFVQRTRDSNEWATQLSIAALARGLRRVIRVVATGVDRGGQLTVHVADYSEGIPPPVPDSVIVVGFNQVQQHYVGLGTMRRSVDRFTLPHGTVVVAFNAGGCTSSTSGTNIYYTLLCNM